jgi:hypothetical protein
MKFYLWQEEAEDISKLTTLDNYSLLLHLFWNTSQFSFA